MLLQFIILIAGLALIVYGANILVEGSSDIARKSGISEFVIGLTIVGMGTSAPEFVVSVISAIRGTSAIAIGNVIGSNIFNTLLILGITAVVLPIRITQSNRYRDVPVNIAVTILFVFFGVGLSFFETAGYRTLSRAEGIIMLLIFAVYIWQSFKKGIHIQEIEEDSPAPVRQRRTLVSIACIIGGLAALVVGGHFLVDSATKIAQGLGISEKFIAVTIIAGGTSLPELATCIVAAVRKKGQLALGNILGSNVFNILLILGTSAAISPLSMDGIGFIDLGVLIFSSLLILLSVYTGTRDSVDRNDGAAFLAVFAAYMLWTIHKL
ncbi:MAG: calcium/sodium antiporter [Bacteroidales bacterium]|nr:calcium/sodium antiporter [Bacteroidales bacterium]